MKKKICGVVACVLVATSLSGSALAASPFPDVDESLDCAEAIEYVNSVGIMTGDETGNFNPDQTLTRAEMAIIVCRMLGETEDLIVSDSFSDVPTNHWANACISKVAELGIMNGYGNDKFGPSDTLTYEQAVTIVIRTIGLSEVAEDAGGYPDGFIEVAQQYQYIDGVSANEGDLMLRWQVATLLYNIIK